MAAVKCWAGEPPHACDVCGTAIAPSRDFVDGRTKYGPWANMCLACHKTHGRGLGVGLGQRYHYNLVTRRHEKVEG